MPFGEYDSSNSSMDGMGLGFNKKVYEDMDTAKEVDERMRREYEESKKKQKKGLWAKMFGKS